MSTRVTAIEIVAYTASRGWRCAMPVHTLQLAAAMREGPPQRAGVVVDRIVMTVLGLAALAGGIALVVYAYTTYQPSEPHHGQALDGLDGIGTFVTMCAGFGGAGLIALGAVMLRAAGRLRP